MNSKVAALTVAFNEPRLLPVCVAQFKKPYLDEDIYHMVLVSSKPWHGNEIYNEKGYFDARGADSIIVDNWRGQAEQFNSGLTRLRAKGFEWAIICDVDEFYTPLSIYTILEEIKNNPVEKCMRIPTMFVYWKNPLFKIENMQTDRPVIAVRTDQFFDSKRNINLSGYDSQAVMFHFSYVRSDAEMLKKINSFEHSDEFDRMSWYNNVWLPWTPDSKNLHPVVPEQFTRAITEPAPKSILNNYVEKEYNFG